MFNELQFSRFHSQNVQNYKYSENKIFIIYSLYIDYMTKNKTHKYNTKVCDDTMSFNECELALLRNEIDKNEKLNVNKLANSEDVKKMISILENFLIRKKLVCYGGTAINNILPVYAQFYNREVDIPDYDFFSPNALEDAKELADIYFK